MLDLQMMQILKAYPEAFLFFSYGSGVYEEGWAREHPDECAGFALSSKETNIYNYWCTKPAPSFASKLYRERGAKTISGRRSAARATVCRRAVIRCPTRVLR